MKKCLLLLFIIVVFIGKAQDTLVLNNSAKIIAVVLLVDKDSIRYKPVTDLSGPDLYISNLDVQLVKYKNGSHINMLTLARLAAHPMNYLNRAARMQETIFTVTAAATCCRGLVLFLAASPCYRYL